MKKYEIKRMSVNEAVELMTLPTIQTVRGSVWDPARKTALVKTLTDGRYIPPVVIVQVQNEDGTAESYCVDGQQRLTTLREAVALKLITGAEEIDVAFQPGRPEEVERSFYELNNGVPVGSAIVASAALNGPARDAVLTLASHPVLVQLFQSTANGKRTGKAADVAMSLIALFAGWDSPDSMSKSAAKAIDEMGDAPKVRPYDVALDYAVKACEAIGKTYAAHAAALEAMPKKDENAKIIKTVMASFRRKNLFLTAANAVMNEINVDAVAALYAKSPESLKATLESVNAKGKPVKVSYKWTCGRGSSGSASEFRDRAIIVEALAASLTAEDYNYKRPSGKADNTTAVSDGAVDTVLAAFGG